MTRHLFDSRSGLLAKVISLGQVSGSGYITPSWREKNYILVQRYWLGLLELANTQHLEK